MSKNTTPIEKYELKNGEKCYLFQIYVGIDPLTGKENVQDVPILKHKRSKT